jgi:hypothetical protein
MGGTASDEKWDAIELAKSQYYRMMKLIGESYSAIPSDFKDMVKAYGSFGNYNNSLKFSRGLKIYCNEFNLAPYKKKILEEIAKE